MIVLFTDFGWRGPYVGQMKAVLAERAPHQPVIDLMHDAPMFRPRLAAHLLAACYQALPENAVVCAVVDPGVGTAREAVLARADGRWLVGPGNGLFDVILARAGQWSCWGIQWLPERLSASFHGRDLFAPVAAHVACGGEVEDIAQPLDWPLAASAGYDLAAIIYIDEFGNAMTGLRAQGIERGARLHAGSRCLAYARTFSEVAPGEAFWYANSLGLIELAVNQGHAARRLGLGLGDKVSIVPPAEAR